MFNCPEVIDTNSIKRCVSMQKYFVYKITNQINEMFYIGVHKSKSPDDGYFGSGKRIVRAVKKYGIDNFKKEILFIFDRKDQAYSKEKELVTKELLDSGLSYNLKIGGEGGWDHIGKDHSIHQLPHVLVMLKARDKKYPLGTFHGRNHSDETRTQMSKSQLKFYDSQREKGIPLARFINHSESTKQKMRISAIGKHAGERNSQYGILSQWITDGISNKRIKKTLDIPIGWKSGLTKNAKKSKV